MSKSEEPEKDENMGQKLCSKFGKVEEDHFPKTLEEFGYQFNKDGQMRHIETGEPFKFEVKEGDRRYNQKHYEALGEVITEHVYQLLEEEAKLKKHFVPVDAKEDEAQSFIFMSEEALACEKLMILIHGSGVVRAGQWARRLIINDDLNCGTMLPYIKRAEKEGFGVLITNGNENFGWNKNHRIPIRGNGISLSLCCDKKKCTLNFDESIMNCLIKSKHKIPDYNIRGSESPEKHFMYVCENFISNASATTIVVVAHSYGGIVIVNGLQKCEGLMDRVKAVAFTDSVHSLAHQTADKKFIKWMRRNAQNWVSSDQPLDSDVYSLFKGSDCKMVSAGTERHELTSHFAFDSVFKFFAERLGSEDEPDISDNQEEVSQTQTDGDESAAERLGSEDEPDISGDQEEVSQTQTDGDESAAEPACEANGATEDEPEPVEVDPAPE